MFLVLQRLQMQRFTTQTLRFLPLDENLITCSHFLFCSKHSFKSLHKTNMSSLLCCGSSREPLLNETQRKKTLKKAINTIRDECTPPYRMRVQYDASGTRAIVTLYQGNLIMLWIACVFGTIFAGCIVMYCLPYYRWRVYIDTREDSRLDVAFGVTDSKCLGVLECVLVPICCSGKVKKEYRKVHEDIRSGLRKNSLQLTDNSPDTYNDYIKSNKINSRKFLKHGLSQAMAEEETLRGEVV